MTKFKEGECVRLKVAIDDLGLDTTMNGFVWALYNTVPQSYEVTFTDGAGVNLDVMLSDDELVSAIQPPTSRAIPRRLNQQSSAHSEATKQSVMH